MPKVNGEWKPLALPRKIGSVLFDNSRQWRYRALYGGRGAGKDWGAKAAICEIGVRKPIRVLFARELMASIKDSSHRLIADTIERLGLGSYYTVLDNEIRGKNGSLFTFRGIRHNTNEIKSMEGIDICVLDEAQPLTEESFNVIDPTIRKAGSEVWFLFNVETESDFVYQFCVKHPPDNLIGSLVNYVDNPYCTKELTDQAEYDKANNYSRYLNKWMGQPLTIGRHFYTFGPHNKIKPYKLPVDCYRRLYGSLDHGIAHYTSFGLWYIEADGQVVRLCSYCQNGGTTEGHAYAIWDMIDSFGPSHGHFPLTIWFDPSMERKHAVSERNYETDIDQYKNLFQSRQKSKGCTFVPANNRKIDGCHMLLQGFDKEKTGRAELVYFDGFNESFEKGIKEVLTDENNIEIYAKQDGDDAADEARYGYVGCKTMASNIIRLTMQSEQVDGYKARAAIEDFEEMMAGSPTGGY